MNNIQGSGSSLSSGPLYGTDEVADLLIDHSAQAASQLEEALNSISGELSPTALLKYQQQQTNTNLFHNLTTSVMDSQKQSIEKILSKL